MRVFRLEGRGQSEILRRGEGRFAYALQGEARRAVVTVGEVAVSRAGGLLTTMDTSNFLTAMDGLTELTVM